MKLQELYADDRAVSPVVGVALLIAMTVILAAVIGAVVLGIGVGPADAPQATLSFEYDGTDTVEMTHEGGDALDWSEITVAGDVTDSSPDDGTMTAGDNENVASDVGDGDEIRIVWEDPNSNSTTVLAEYTV